MGASPSRDAQQRMYDALCSMEIPTDQKKKRQVVLVPLTSMFMNRVSTSATTSELRLKASPEELPLMQQLMRAYKEPKVQFCLRHNGWGRADCIPPFLYVNSATALYETTVKTYDQRVVASDKALVDLWQAQELNKMAAHDQTRPEGLSDETDARLRRLYPIPCAICFQYSTGTTDFPDDDSVSSGSSGGRSSKNSRGSGGSNHSRRSNLAAGRIAPMGSVVMGPTSSIMVVGFIGIVPTSTGTNVEFVKPPPQWREASDDKKLAAANACRSPASPSADGSAGTSSSSSSSLHEWELVMFISKAAGDQHLSRALFLAAYTYISECRQAGVAGCAYLPPLRYASFLTDVSFLSFLREVRLRAMDFRWDAVLSLGSRQVEITADESAREGASPAATPKSKSAALTLARAPHNRMLVGHLSSAQAMHWCSLLAEAQPGIGYHPITPVPVYYFYGFVSVPVEANVLHQAKGLFFWTRPSSASLLETILKKSSLPSKGGAAILELITPQLPPGSTTLPSGDAEDRTSNKSTPGSMKESTDQLKRRRSPPETQREVSLYAIVSLRPINTRAASSLSSASSRKSNETTGATCARSVLTTLVVRQRVSLLTGEFVLPGWQLVTDSNEAVADAQAAELEEWDVDTDEHKSDPRGAAQAGDRPPPLMAYEVLLSWIKGVYLRGRQADPDHINWVRAYTHDFYDQALATPAGPVPSPSSKAKATTAAPTSRLPLTRASLDALIEQTQRAVPRAVDPTAMNAFLHVWDVQPPNVCTPGFPTTVPAKGMQKEGNLYMALIPDYVRAREEARKAAQITVSSDPQIRKKDSKMQALNALAMNPRTMKNLSPPDGVTGGSGHPKPVSPSTHPACGATTSPSACVVPKPRSHSQRSSSVNSEMESGLASPTSTISNLGLQQMWVTGSQYNARGTQSPYTQPQSRGSGYRQRPPPAMTTFATSAGNTAGSGSGGRRGSRRQDMFASTPQSAHSPHSSQYRHSSSSVDSQNFATPMSFNSFDDRAFSAGANNHSNNNSNPTTAQSILVASHANAGTGAGTQPRRLSVSGPGNQPGSYASRRGSAAEYDMFPHLASMSANDLDGQYGLQRGASNMDPTTAVGYSTYGEDYYDFYPEMGEFGNDGRIASYRAPPLQSLAPPVPTSAHASPPALQRRLSAQAPPVPPISSNSGSTNMNTPAPLPRSRQPPPPMMTTTSNALADLKDMYGMDPLEDYGRTSTTVKVRTPSHVTRQPSGGQRMVSTMVDPPNCQTRTPHSQSSRTPATPGVSATGSGIVSARGSEVHGAKEFLATSGGSQVYRWNWRNSAPAI